MDIPGVKPVITEFVFQLVRTGFMLSELASDLIDRAAGRTLEHLQLACALSHRLHSSNGDKGPSYG